MHRNPITGFYFATCEGDTGKVGEIIRASYEEVKEEVVRKLTEIFGQLYVDVDVRFVYPK